MAGCAGRNVPTFESRAPQDRWPAGGPAMSHWWRWWGRRRWWWWANCKDCEHEAIDNQNRREKLVEGWTMSDWWQRGDEKLAQPVQSMTREIWRLKGEDEDPKRIQDFHFVSTLKRFTIQGSWWERFQKSNWVHCVNYNFHICGIWFVGFHFWKMIEGWSAWQWDMVGHMSSPVSSSLSLSLSLSLSYVTKKYISHWKRLGSLHIGSLTSVLMRSSCWEGAVECRCLREWVARPMRPSLHIFMGICQLHQPSLKKAKQKLRLSE